MNIQPGLENVYLKINILYLKKNLKISLSHLDLVVFLRSSLCCVANLYLSQLLNPLGPLCVDDTPETCIYSNWSPWSACSSSTCEKGKRMRQRMLKAQLDLSVPCPHTQDFQPCMGPGCSSEGEEEYPHTVKGQIQSQLANISVVYG